MSEESATHALSLAHAETQTHNSASTTHTGGPMQLPASADTEENRVSTLKTWSFLCFTQLCLNFGTTQKYCRTCASKAVFIWHSAGYTVTARVVPLRVTTYCIPCCWNSILSNILLQGNDQTHRG